MTPTPATAAPQPVYSRRCKERCLGVLYHSGHHQTSDYDAIRREARAAAIAQVRAALERAYKLPRHMTDEGGVRLLGLRDILALLDAAATPAGEGEA